MQSFESNNFTSCLNLRSSIERFVLKEKHIGKIDLDLLHQRNSNKVRIEFDSWNSIFSVTYAFISTVNTTARFHSSHLRAKLPFEFLCLQQTKFVLILCYWTKNVNQFCILSINGRINIILINHLKINKLNSYIQSFNIFYFL